ncbi:hypothetical protein NS14008_34290 [Nocardia seriolae]|nr:hypothetical protein NS14008_34290 [Nocardia seriolae]
MHEALAVAGPLHLGLTGDAAGELIGGTVGDDAPAREDQDAVRQLLGLVQIVGGEQDGGVVVVGQAVHQIVEFAACLRIEARGRLVQEQQFGTADNADGHVQAPALTAGQRHHLGVGVLGEPDRGDEFVGVPRPLDGRGGVRRVEHAQVVEQFADPPLAVVAPGLQHHAQPRPPRLVPVRGVGAQHLDPSGRAHAEALEDLDGGGLARAVRAEQGDHLAAMRLEGDVLQDIAGAVAHAQVLDVQHDAFVHRHDSPP